MEAIGLNSLQAYTRHRKEFEIQRQCYLDEKVKHPGCEKVLKPNTKRRKKAWDSLNKSFASSIKAARTNTQISELMKGTAKVQKPLPYGGVAGHALQLVAEQQRKVYFKENDMLWKMQFVDVDEWDRSKAAQDNEKPCCQGHGC